MLAIIEAAGWPIWLIIAASVATVTIIIERFLSLRRSQILPEGLLARAVQDYRGQGVNAEMLGKLSASSPLGRVLAAGLKNVRSSREIMKESIEEAGSVIAHDLERYLPMLGTLAAVTPLLGLFGTVIGMIEIFGSQSPTGAANPAALAHGISVALYNTAFGIMVAVPALMFYRFFRGKVDGFLVEMEQQAVKLVEVVHGERN
ncbi:MULTISPECIES: MotA/TolQ/ExbB proton channel family protein [unclassified Iodobacter]|jgi:biopolymer transport protein ExbB|uniref:MotA/TolQ/ExbB proton channel family protein n=1 Tax=unclassified Iodobacter TaxID=235634 RepID=UPI0025E5661F|nr:MULTISPECIES: MotA/TolQ/ExbB proton channel family protein [unclassified Iodobacter]MDW5416516.1 MotA/TolQ/ExbB proton channel family protein [Iodobacter sp. CM08]